jgi:hypothetical protein
MYSTMNSIFNFTHFDSDYPAFGLSEVYCILMPSEEPVACIFTYPEEERRSSLGNICAYLPYPEALHPRRQ